MTGFPIRVRVPKLLARDLFEFRLRGGPTDAAHWRAWRAAFDAAPGKLGPVIEIADAEALRDLLGDCDLYSNGFDASEFGPERAAARTFIRRVEGAR